MNERFQTASSQGLRNDSGDEPCPSRKIIERGFLDVAFDDHVRIQIEAMRCFGFEGKGWQRGAWPIPDGSGDRLWFPRLFPREHWFNELSSDGKTIFERPLTEWARDSLIHQSDTARQSPASHHIVFGKAKDGPWANLFKYLGTFRVNLESSSRDFLRFDLIRTREPVRIGYPVRKRSR